MPLTPDTRLGPYVVIGPLGAGGMGEVYRARDPRLDRDVAIKILPDALAADPDRLLRFRREARALAALAHPNVAAVYDFEESGAARALVMELVPGESLADRILGSGGAPGLPFDAAQGRQTRGLPVRDALEFARQIADGLEAAHEKGIVHRDLKPANIQVTPDGQVKILDFGLAKALSPGPGSSDPGLHGDVEDSPTLTAGTRHGVILGTAAYMSPEQARGHAVDRRTDVWAFGCVLYEMLTSRRAFAGETATDALAAVLGREPDWAALPAATPAAIRALLQRCLRKEPRQRLHDIADARFTIEEALAVPGSAFDEAQAKKAPGLSVGDSSAATSPHSVWRHPLPIGLALLVLVLGAAVIWLLAGAAALPAQQPVYFSLVLPPEQELVGEQTVAVSPDGRDVVYAAVVDEGPPGPEGNKPRLFLRRLTEQDSRALPETENPHAVFFSPDGQSVAFLSAAGTTLKKISLHGGGPVLVAEVTGSVSGTATWAETDDIFVGGGNIPIQRVPASGGQPEVVVPRSVLEPGEQGMIAPVPLPGGGMLFQPHRPEAEALVVWAGGTRRTLVSSGFAPRLFGDTHLMFWRRASAAQVDLCAVAFDPVRAAVRGEPVALLSAGLDLPFAVSDAGTLVYRARQEQAFGFQWLALGARPAPPLPANPRSNARGIYSPRVSPDGRLVAYTQGFAGTNPTLVLADLKSGASRVLATGRHFWLAWTPDSRRVVYQVPPDTPGGAGMVWRAVDGEAQAERLTTSTSWQQPQVVTADGRFLVYQETGGLGTRDSTLQDNYDLWILPLNPRGEPKPLLRTEANERLPHVSADGRWLAYVSDETGRDQVWVRPFPDGSASFQVTQDGGTEPVWAPDGTTLYYRDAAGTGLVAVPVNHGGTMQFGQPVVTSGFWYPGYPFGRMYDVAPDGSALLMLKGRTYGRELRVVQHLDALIRQKLAAAGR